MFGTAGGVEPITLARHAKKPQPTADDHSLKSTSRASIRPPCSIAAPAKAICVPTPRFDPVLCSIAAGSRIFRVLLSRVVNIPQTNCQGMPLRRSIDDKLYYSNRRFRLLGKQHQRSKPSLESREPNPKRRKSTAAFMVRAIKRRVSP